MIYSEDHIALAAEYALGTLPADERALVETMMIVDPGFRDVVEAWDRKLGPLQQMVAPIEPPPYLWESIKAAAAIGEYAVAVVEEPPAEVAEPVAVDPAPTANTMTGTMAVADSWNFRDIPEPPEGIAAAEAAPVPEPGPEVELKSGTDSAPALESGAAEALPAPDRTPPAPEIVAEPVTPPIAPPAAAGPSSPVRGGGRVFGMAMAVAAAALAGVIALQAHRPDLLPEPLRVKPKVEVVQVAAPPPPQAAQFVAVLQQNAAPPAFILTVDAATRNFTVRRVGAAPQPGKSYELWLVSDRLQRPRSLGVIGASDFTIRPSLAAYDGETIDRATYAVTLEPEGGSPTGVATGPILYTGKLVESVPELPAQAR